MVEVNLDAEESAPETKVTAPKAVASAGKVKIQLADEDDDEVVAVSHPKPLGKGVATPAQKPVDDDDFMRAADEILNG
jgi:hypothetical protein